MVTPSQQPSRSQGRGDEAVGGSFSGVEVGHGSWGRAVLLKLTDASLLEHLLKQIVPPGFLIVLVLWWGV